MSEVNEQSPVEQSESEKLGDAGMKALVAERARANEAEKKFKAAERRLQELEDAGKSELEKAQATAESASAEVAQLQSEIKSRELQLLKQSIGIETGLPANLIDRLQGDDEEALRADAKSLADFIPDTSQSPFPKADPSQGAKETSVGGTTADKFAAAFADRI